MLLTQTQRSMSLRQKGGIGDTEYTESDDGGEFSPASTRKKAGTIYH